MGGALISGAIRTKLGIKKTLVMGAVLLSTLPFGQILPSRRAELMRSNIKTESIAMSKSLNILFMVLSSVFTGVANSIIWVAEGEYISNCASEQNSGLYYGISGSFYVSSSILGNFVASLLVKELTLPFFFLVMGCISCFAVLGLS